MDIINQIMALYRAANHGTDVSQLSNYVNSNAGLYNLSPGQIEGAYPSLGNSQPNADIGQQFNQHPVMLRGSDQLSFKNRQPIISKNYSGPSVGALSALSLPSNSNPNMESMNSDTIRSAQNNLTPDMYLKYGTGPENLFFQNQGALSTMV